MKEIFIPQNVSKLDWTELNALKMAAEATDDLRQRIEEIHQDLTAKLKAKLEARHPDLFKLADIYVHAKEMRTLIDFPSWFHNRVQIVIDTFMEVSKDAVAYRTYARMREAESANVHDRQWVCIMAGRPLVCFWSHIPTDYIKGDKPPNDFNHH